MSLAGPDRRGSVLSGSAARVALAIVLMAALMLTGCQPSTVITSLRAVLVTAEVLVQVLGATAGIPPEVLAAVALYGQAVNAFIVQAAIILDGPGTLAEKGALLTQAAVSIADGCNCLPPGTPQAVVDAVNAVVKGLGDFLGNFQPKQAALAAQTIKLSRTDRAALSNIRGRAEQNLAKLKDLAK